MTWVAEGILNQDQPWQSWKPRSDFGQETLNKVRKSWKEGKE
jgi:hypothetical protein